MHARVVGGIHPVTPWDSGCVKEKSTWTEFRPAHIYLSMCQGDEAPCRPIVHVGERVRVPQPVGEASDKKSVDIHSGISGTVVAIRDEDNALSGTTETVVIIENDGLDEPFPLHKREDDVYPGREALAGIIKHAGIVGMGGAAFPSHAKLGGGGGLEILLVNGAECEPLLCADAALMLARSEAIVDGCRLIMEALGIPTAILGIESDKPSAIAEMCKQTEGVREVRVESLPRIYPMGGEKQLILKLTGKEVPAGKLPSDVGAIVFNVATIAAVADAVRRGIPLTHRICSVVGDVAAPRNIRFPVGSCTVDVVEFCGGWVGEPSRVIVGGPMMGKAAANADAVLSKTANGLLLMNREHDPDREERPCIRCNRCSDACPMRLMPQFLDMAGRKENWRESSRLSAERCINCGCCSHVCPAFIPLAANITQTAKKLKSIRKDSL